MAIDIFYLVFVVALVVGIALIPKLFKPSKGRKEDPPDSSFGSLDGR